MKYLLLIFFSLSSCFLNAAPSTQLISFSIKPTINQTTLIYNLNKKTYGLIKYIPSSHELLIELENTVSDFPIAEKKVTNSNVKFYKVESTKTHGLRFRFFVANDIQYQSKFVSNSLSAQLRIEIISKPIINPVHKIVTTSPLLAENKHTALFHRVLNKEILQDFSEMTIQQKHDVLKENHMVRNLKLPREKIKKSAAGVFTIVIDPGHGGKDSGAQGAAGILEKNIVLAIAKDLSNEINKSKNMRAVLTRSKDQFIPLRTRLHLARKVNADLFIAIHADAYFNKYANGASVYALSQRGATSEAARWLAKQDNYSELGEVALQGLSDRSLVLRSVLIDLAQTATIQDSVLLGNKVLDELESISSLHYAHVEQAPFVVLKSPDIPSILIETGFLSNIREEGRLNDPAYQHKIAKGIWQAIQNYVTVLNARNHT